MKRIGIFDASRESSGISRYVRALIGGMNLDEFDVTVFTNAPDVYQDLGVTLVNLQDGGDAAPDQPAPLRVSMRSTWRRYSPGALNMLAGFSRESMKLAHVFRRNPVDLLHVQLVGADEAAAAARWAGVKRVLGTLHIDSSQSGAKRWLVETMTNHCLDRAIAVSRATAADWIARTALPPRCVTTIPNGVNVEYFYRRRTQRDARQLLGLPDAPTVIAVGRLCEQKGLTYLLDAIGQLRRRLPRVSLLLAGDGPARRSLGEQARRLGIETNVHFLGKLDDVRPALEAADVFVLPSLWEAMPYALLEAMSLGLPPVATRVAGVPEVIDDGVSGLLVPPRDVSTLIGSIHRLLASSSMRERFARAARERVASAFDERHMISRTLGCYRALLKPIRSRSLHYSRSSGTGSLT